MMTLTDGDGTVSFRKFVVGMGMLGSKHHEVDPMSYFCFKLIDADRRGKVSRDELLSIVWHYVKEKEKQAHRAEARSVHALGKKLSEYSQDEGQAQTRPPQNYPLAPQRGNQNVDKLKKRNNDLDELLAWANNTATPFNHTKEQDKESAVERKRIERTRVIRRKMQDAVIILRQQYPTDIHPQDFKAILAKIPDPFLPVFEMFRTVKPYLATCAKVVDTVPSLHLDELRAAHSTAIWKEEQKPEWFFQGDERRRRQRDERDPELLEELATMSQRREMESERMMMEIGVANEKAGAGDGSGTEYRVGLDGKLRKKRGLLGPKVGGRSHAMAESARMRVIALTKIDPKEALEELEFVSERARTLALNMISPEEAARIVHAMPPRVRKEIYGSLHPRVEHLVLEIMKTDRGWDPASKLLALVQLPDGTGTQGMKEVGRGENRGPPGWERHRRGGGGAGELVKAPINDFGRPMIGPDIDPEDLGEIPLSPTARARQTAMVDPYGQQISGGGLGGGSWDPLLGGAGMMTHPQERFTSDTTQQYHGAVTDQFDSLSQLHPHFDSMMNAQQQGVPFSYDGQDQPLPPGQYPPSPSQTNLYRYRSGYLETLAIHS